MICKVCSNLTTPFARAKLLGKYDAQYFQCGFCGFTQTESPYWIKEAYSSAITSSDIGLVGRSSSLAAISKLLILACFNSQGKFIDYAGGYGLFVRMMRDFGFDFYWYDKFCLNIHAKGFEADMETGTEYELATAFEVFEHFVDPFTDLEMIMRFSKNVLFSTLLIPPGNPSPYDWWYYGLDHGQHVSLYTRESLGIIARKLGLNLCSNGRSIHLFTQKRIAPVLFGGLSCHRIAKLLSLLIRKPSLVGSDFFRVTGQKLS